MEKQQYYEMCLEFSLTVSFKQINQFLQACQFQERPILRCVKVSLKQTVPFIPTEKHLRAYEEAIQKTYETEDIACEECHFTGYKYLRPITE